MLVLLFSESLLPARVENHCKIVIWKADRKLELYEGNQLAKTYRICLGWNPLGAKQITQDGKTPEGDYFICYKTEASKFYRFLGISYPGATMQRGDSKQERFHDQSKIVSTGSGLETILRGIQRSVVGSAYTDILRSGMTRCGQCSSIPNPTIGQMVASHCGIFRNRRALLKSKCRDSDKHSPLNRFQSSKSGETLLVRSVSPSPFPRNF